MATIDPNSLLVGMPKQIKPIMQEVRHDDGTVERILVPRVAVCMIADDLIASIAATSARLATIEILGALQEVGAIPEGTLQKYMEPLQSEEAPAGEEPKPDEAPQTPSEV